MDDEEFRSLVLRSRNTNVKVTEPVSYVSLDRSLVSGAIDWRDTGAVGPVLDQGECGSCWTFSTTVTLEAALQFRTGKYTALSQ